MMKKTRLIVKKGNENVVLRVENIAFIYRDNAIVFAVDKDEKKYLCDKNITALEAELDQNTFFRANRKYLLNIDYINGYKPCDKVKLEVCLSIANGTHKVVVSQETAPQFRKWISEA